MRTTLFLSSLLLLSACSDNTPSNKVSQPKSINTVSVEKNISKPIPKAQAQPIAKKSTPVNGHSIYAHKCASCHGQQGEKVALNSSSIIRGWQSSKTVDALKGYQYGTYGKKLQGIMKAQAKALNDAQIKAVSAYIATL